MGSLLLVACGETAAEFEPTDGEEQDAGAAGNTDPLKTEQPAPDASAADAALIDASMQAASDASQPLHPSYAQAYTVFAERCLDCHGAGKTLDLSTPEIAHRELVGVPARYKACASDAGMPKIRVISGMPGSSLLVEKIDGTPSCGKPMPTMGMLAPSEIGAIRAWVEGGAKLR